MYAKDSYEYGWNEIAEIMGCPVSEVRNLYASGMRKIMATPSFMVESLRD